MLRHLLWKEFTEILRDKSIVSSVSSVSLLMVTLGLTTLKYLSTHLETFILYMTPSIGVLVGFSLSYRFTREKIDGTIETLLSTPLTLKELWLSKVAGLTVLSYVISLASTLTLGLVKNVPVPMDVNTVIYLVMSVPVSIASSIGLLGYLHYLLGMKQVQALNYIVFFTLFITLYFIVKELSIKAIITHVSVTHTLTMALAILGITYYLVSRLSEERVITSIN